MVDEIIEKAHHMREMEIVKEQAVGEKAIVLFGADNCGHAVYRFLEEWEELFELPFLIKEMYLDYKQVELILTIAGIVIIRKWYKS